MDAPVIDTITPAGCLVRGSAFVKLTGQRFKTAHPVPDVIPAPPPAPSVRVTFGTEVSRKVIVVSSTELWALAPQQAAGVVAVRLDNMEPTGEPTPGEYVVKLAAFTYKRPDLTQQSTLQRVVASLIVLMRQQVLDNLVTSTDTDYDDNPEDGYNTIAEGKLPIIVLTGPEMRENRMLSTNQARLYANTDGTVSVLNPPMTVDLQFVLTGAADTTGEMLNLQSELSAFFASNPYLFMRSDPADASSALVKYELTATFEGQPDVQAGVNLSNVRQFSGVVLLRGIDVEWSDEAAADRTAAVGGEGSVNIVVNPLPVGNTTGETITL